MRRGWQRAFKGTLADRAMDGTLDVGMACGPKTRLPAENARPGGLPPPDLPDFVGARPC